MEDRNLRLSLYKQNKRQVFREMKLQMTPDEKNAFDACVSEIQLDNVCRKIFNRYFDEIEAKDLEKRTKKVKARAS